MGFPWSETINGVIAALAAAAAGGSWKAAHRSSATADAVARIERERWHADLTPQFDITLAQTGASVAYLTVHLEGPDHLRELDEVTIAVGNDDMEHTALHPGPRATQADYDAFVWGPYRFQPRTDGADEHGRSPSPFPLVVGRGRPFFMEHTRPGGWMIGTTEEMWQQEHANQPVRLILTCRRGHEEWVIARSLDNPSTTSRA
ncbi:hypothetical protein [Actinacidiphila oryziradicis]|uniref:Uncharacterized protein n=1 Tax=Actinacidiphila oryziradicis TaxID=2571141 RepID=A0A4U0RZU2_9ACTN|nr:hypothetical protein [Actinacidiphila oryziradicis]TKA01990.1 hypothetical protein FCI23_39670 [Actinacidiphila oryziradicis]